MPPMQNGLESNRIPKRLASQTSVRLSELIASVTY